MTDVPLSQLGALLERSRRAQIPAVSGREAARRAGISESRWRQVLREERPPARTIVAAALAVGADPAAALAAAGTPATDDAVAALVADAQRRAEAPRPGSTAGLADEIERIQSLPLPAEERLRVANAVIAMYEEKARQLAEQGAD